MSVNYYNKDTGELVPVANGTLFADAPVGSIQAYGGATAPSGWLLCQGQAVSRTEYAELFAAIGIAFGEGDGSTTFNVPDLREATTKGIGLSGKSIHHYDNDGIALGEFVEDRIRLHAHNVYVRDTGHTHSLALALGAFPAGGQFLVPYNAAPSTVVTDSASANIQVNSSPSFDGFANTTSNSGVGDTNEVKAVGVNYIIKAKQVAMPVDFMDAVNDTVDEAVTEKLHYNGRVNTNVRTFITSSQTFTFTASKTGLLKAYMHKSGSGYTARLFVNGVSVDQLSCFGKDSSGTALPWIENGGIDATLSAFVKEGDAVKIDSDESDSASTNSWYLYATVLQYKS